MCGAPRSRPSEHHRIDAGYIRERGYYAFQKRIVLHAETFQAISITIRFWRCTKE